MRKLAVALMLAATLVFTASPAQAQLPPKVYWGCQYYIFWTGPWMFDIKVTGGNDPSNGFGWYDGTGWLCQYIATCYYTQDIFGNIEEFCS